ncbi:hypothetical protein ACFYO0_14595 [Streptomyces sp. NPDC006365]|uniref:hypothetical protein n=1 Tax=Streptomyces sp. NPDC006365 TaxID=3364744 RepID=UPI003687DCA2
MAVLKCEQYPQLQVHTPAGRVQFTDGLAEATDEQIKALEGLARKFGIELVDVPDEESPGGGDGPEEIKPPARSASKADWVAYADKQDEAVDHSSMTKERLIEQYGAAE